jgi:hypothetical protein
VAGKIWTSKEFAYRVGFDDKTVRNWRTGRTVPVEIISIERELFGENPVYAIWREELRQAHHLAKAREPVKVANEDHSTKAAISSAGVSKQNVDIGKLISDLRLHLGVADVPTGKWTLAAILNLLAAICTVAAPFAELAVWGLYLSVAIFVASFSGVAFNFRYSQRCHFPCVAAAFSTILFFVIWLVAPSAPVTVHDLSQSNKELFWQGDVIGAMAAKQGINFPRPNVTDQNNPPSQQTFLSAAQNDSSSVGTLDPRFAQAIKLRNQGKPTEANALWHSIYNDNERTAAQSNKVAAQACRNLGASAAARAMIESW